MHSGESPALQTVERAPRSEVFRALVRRVEEMSAEAILLRERLHADPRLSGQEEDAAALLAEQLPCEMRRVAGTGRIGRIGPAVGPTIAIRAELDALPIVEATGAPFASTNGAMHACGHDVHQAALVLLARAASGIELPYALAPVLQPREEAYPSGALDVVSSGALDSYDVGVVIAAHVHPGIELGSVATGHGVTNAAADEVRVTVHGTGGHGAYPHEASNPITVLAHIAVGFAEVLNRTVNPMRPAVLTVGSFRSGDVANVIPDRAELSATLRTMDEQDRARVHDALRAYAEGQASSFGITAEVEIIRGEPMLENDSELVDLVDSRLGECGFAVTEPLRSCGADDFSYFSASRPGIMSFVGVRTEGADAQPPLHSRCFLPDEDSVRRVALALVASYIGACDYLDGRETA